MASIPVITSAIAGSTPAAQDFTYTITATNTPTSFSVSPPLTLNLSLDTRTGIISGRSYMPGVYMGTVSASNSAGTGSLGVTFTINQPVINPTPAITSAATASLAFGGPASYQITASNTPWTYQAFFPIGISGSINNSTGLILFDPLLNKGVFMITILATNPSGTASQTVTVTVS